jgi:hypothetical protein
MNDEKVGYGKPPKASRFKPGVSGNPMGRPKRKPVPYSEALNHVLDAPIEYLERGRSKVTTRRELNLKRWVDRAVNGDIHAAAHILKIRAQAEYEGEPGSETILVRGWLWDHPGQTAEQKTQAAMASKDGEPLKWWETESISRSEGSGSQTNVAAPTNRPRD